jgi:adenine-specific DNA methylase
MEGKRLIEVDFPLGEVGVESTKEKYIRNHPATLHTWWARRPLAVSRATTFAALIPTPKNDDELRKKLQFIVKLSKWENSRDKRLMENARSEIRNLFGGAPRVLDCFAGGGAIPLESLRLGCETYALELNPVAVIILKALLEFPQKFGKGKEKTSQKLGGIPTNPLVEDVRKWGNWVLKETKEEIERFYPHAKDGSIPVGYIWARTIKCQNPSCGAQVPLLRQLWLIRKKEKEMALKLNIDKKNKRIDFSIVQGREIDFDPSQGTARKGTAICYVCGSGTKSISKLAREGKVGQRLIAAILHNDKKIGKSYRVVDDKDRQIYSEAEQYLEEKVRNWKWDFNPIPNEPTPSGEGPGAERAFSLRNYGLDEWGDLFNSRQKLALATFVEKIRLAYDKMQKEGYDPEYSKAIMTYLAVGLDRLANRASTLTYWYTYGEKIQPTFVRQALSIVWDYVEVNPFSGSSGDWRSAVLTDICNAISACSGISTKHANILQGTATRLPYPNTFFDAVITDPPYYDNVPYSDLSDFFYVWLKRTIGELYPALFATPLTPKSQEIIVHTLRHGNSFETAKKFYEDMMTQSFKEIHRVLKLDGIAVIVFAYKSTEAWETIINSLLKSGLVLTASWPIHTEMATRLRAKESATLASSIYMVCRKRIEEKTVYFNEIKEEIEGRIKEKLKQFWDQGISGADFFVSAIGPAVEVFGKYSKVEKLSGEEVSVQELLEYIRKIVSEFALERVLNRADLGGVDAETRFYLLWRWTFGNAKVHFDDAIKLSRPMGVELTSLWDKGGLVKKEKEFIIVLPPQERTKDTAFTRRTKFVSIVDVLHYTAAFWEKGQREKIKEILNETGYAGNEIFWQTAQAISEILPKGDKEKQLLQGFLYGKEVYVKEARGKTSLTDYMEGS